MQNGTDVATLKNKKIINKKGVPWNTSKQPWNLGLLDRIKQRGIPFVRWVISSNTNAHFASVVHAVY